MTEEKKSYEKYLNTMINNNPEEYYLAESFGIKTLKRWAYCNKCPYAQTYCFEVPSCLKGHEIKEGKHKCLDFP